MRRIAVIAGIVGILAVSTPAAPGDEDVDLREWARGPIRYLITAEEERSFKKLRTDDARAAFVERFWTRRDPTPDTWFNEYRQDYWQRVHDANEKFMDSAGPGWKTDRGKIYILYGPPDRVQEDSGADVQGMEVNATRGLIRWFYESRPGGRKDLADTVVVPFVRTLSGEYRVSSDPRLASPFFDTLLLSDRRSPNAWDRYRVENAASASRLSVMLDLGKMQEVPPQEQILLERVETQETYAQRPLLVRLDRFEPPNARDALVVATLDLPPGSDTPAIIVRLTSHDAGRAPKILAEGAFRTERVGAGRVAQGRTSLEPGTWEVLALVVDPGEAANRIWRGAITVAPQPTGLRLSDVVLAARVDPLEFKGLTGYDAPYTLGGFRIVPRIDAAIPRGEAIQLFFEAYGGTPPYAASFALDGREEDGRFRELAPPQRFEQPAPAFAWSLPTTPSWPLGEYRVRIELRDAAGATVKAVVPFRLTG